MIRSGSCSVLLFAFAVFGLTSTISGCMHHAHPDVKLAVYNSLDESDLRSVTVSQDRDAGTITLSGIVGADDRRQRAEQIVQQAAPGYTIVNRIQVDNAGLEGQEQNAEKSAQLDNSIEDHYRATLAEHRPLNGEDILCSANNGTLTLKGSVKTYKEREEAENLAKKIPEVLHVVNEIQVRNGRPTPANS